MAAEALRVEPYLDAANALVRETRARGGLAPVDLEKFWADQEIARQDPFGGDIPQVALGIHMSGECVYAELGLAQDFWRYAHDEDWRLELNKAYNDKAERIVGRRLLSETRGDPALRYPETGGLHTVFEAENVWDDRSQSYWLQQSADNEDELKALLDRVEDRLAKGAVRGLVLPSGWDAERERLMALDVKPRLYRGQRGPTTFATSVYGVENLLFLILDNPDLAVRFSRAILATMLELGRISDEEAGYTPATAPRGFSFADDNCYLLSPAMYELFSAPVLQGMFDRYAPDPADRRSQHSDSSMCHLLPVLARFNMHSVNFGPTVMADAIRRHMPRTIIQGVLAPFTFSRNDEVNIVAEFLRDHAMTRDSRGLSFFTAGSINNGSRLTGMRLIMAAIQRYGRFDG